MTSLISEKILKSNYIFNAMVFAADEKVYCDCPRYHTGLVSIRTRRRHYQEAGMINPPEDTTLQSRDGLLGPQITTTNTIPEETDNNHALPVYDFDDWSMDIEGEGDGGFFSNDRSQTTSEDEGDADESHEEDEDTLQKVIIESGEESTFSDEGWEGTDDEEPEDLDDRMHDRTDDEDEDSLRLLLHQLKELSGISH